MSVSLWCNFDNDKYDEPPDEYDDEQEFWSWNYDDSDISMVCDNCTEFIIKGEPAINRIEYIVVGVANNLDSKVFGNVYINELRLTGVKKEGGSAFRFKTSMDFADLLSLRNQQ